MHLELLFRLPLEAAAIAQFPQAGDECDDPSPRGHRSVRDNCRSRAMIPAIRSQSSVWAAS